MSIEEQMSIDERRKYLHKMRIRYWQAQSRKEHSKLLDEMKAVTELHRKSLLRLIHGDLARKPRRQQRGKSYGAEVKAVVQVIAESLDFPCAERLHPALTWMAEHLSQHGEFEVDPGVLEKLEQMSVSTLWRLLPRAEPSRLAYRKSRSGASTSLRQAVPVRRIRWDEPEPGHFEVDLVHHCGTSSDGQYVHTLQLVNVASGWSECAAILGRSHLVMEDGFKRILKRLPFPVVELHPDNGMVSSFSMPLCSNSGKLLSKVCNYHAADHSRRTITALLKRTISAWCVPISVISAWIPHSRQRCSTNYITSFGFTTTSFNPLCA